MSGTSCAPRARTVPSRAGRARPWAAGRPAGCTFRRRRSIPLVLTLLRRPFRDGHRLIADVGLRSFAPRDQDMLEPLGVVALRIVCPRMRPAAFFALDRTEHGRFRAVEHETEFEREGERLIRSE